MDSGTEVGRYRIEASLGKGGMGEVYRAFDPTLRRRVALKVVLGERVGEEEIARVLREARAVAALNHPHVVAVYDAGIANDNGYIVMELVDGPSLRRMMEDGAIPQSRALRWLREIASALASAHATGVVHRDVKPENVMIANAGGAKLLDFGIVKRAARAEGDDAAPSSDALTAESTLLGTPRYMAPEQLVGLEVDGRTDQFAWGLVAYEILTGKHPRVATGRDTPSWERLAAQAHDIPPSVRKIVLRALSLSPEARYPTMDELALDLDRALAQSETEGPTRMEAMEPVGASNTTLASADRPAPKPDPQASTPAPTRRTPLVLSAFVVAALVGIIVYPRLFDTRPPPASPREHPPPSAVSATVVPAPVSKASRRVAMGAAMRAKAQQLTILRDADAVLVTTGQLDASGAVRVERVTDAKVETIPVALGASFKGDVALVAFDESPAIAWEENGIVGVRLLREKLPRLAKVISRTPRVTPVLAAAFDDASLAIVAIAKEDIAGAKVLPQIVFHVPTCAPQAIEIAIAPGQTVSLERPEVVVNKRVAHVRLHFSDVSTSVTTFELGADCRLAPRGAAQTARDSTSSLFAVDDGVLLVGQQNPESVVVAPLAEGLRMPMPYVFDAVAPRAFVLGEQRLMAWIESTGSGSRVHAGRVFEETEKPIALAAVGGPSDAVIAWAVGSEVRLETIRLP